MVASLAALITLFEGLIILRAFLSFFTSPHSTHPAIEMLHRVTEPVLGPVRKALPATEGIDLSPLIVLIGLELLKRVLL